MHPTTHENARQTLPSRKLERDLFLRTHHYLGTFLRSGLNMGVATFLIRGEFTVHVFSKAFLI